MQNKRGIIYEAIYTIYYYSPSIRVAGGTPSRHGHGKAAATRFLCGWDCRVAGCDPVGFSVGWHGVVGCGEGWRGKRGRMTHAALLPLWIVATATIMNVRCAPLVLARHFFVQTSQQSGVVVGTSNTSVQKVDELQSKLWWYGKCIVVPTVMIASTIGAT